jgi:hypothetical protein
MDMDKILNIGKYVFPLSFLMYVGLHAGKPEVGASFVPSFIPFPLFWNYFTMVCILLFIVSALIQKYDKLAYSLMALYVLLMAILVHLPRSMGVGLDVNTMTDTLAREKELEMINVFRNIMVMAALMTFAKFVAKDKRWTKG